MPSPILELLESIRTTAIDIVKNLGEGDKEKARAQLQRILELDVKILRVLEEEGNRNKLLTNCRRILADVKEALQEIPQFQNQERIRAFMTDVVQLEQVTLAAELAIEQRDEDTQKEFFVLMSKDTINEKESEAFLKRIKGNTSKSVFKQMTKYLEKRLEVPLMENPGPRYSTEDILRTQNGVYSFFRSPYAKSFPEKEEVKFYFFGSLVNGYSNNLKSSHYGKPSDVDRLSDVDILVLVSKNMFHWLFDAHPELVEHVSGNRKSIPIGFDTKGNPAKVGPFFELLSDLSKLGYAQRRERPVHFVFMEKPLFTFFDLIREPHLHICDVTTY